MKRWGSNAERTAAFIAVVQSPEDISKTVHYTSQLILIADSLGNSK